MRLVIFVNDSYFAYLLGKPLIGHFGGEIAGAVFSTRITGSLRTIRKIYKRTHWRYFVYRCLVDLVSKIIKMRGKTVRGLLRTGSTPVWHTPRVTAEGLRALCPVSDLGVALNFDQVIPREVLQMFRDGVINLHASRLPADKGISPVLWAHARGDSSIWTSIYRMEEHLDCGEILRQYETPVEPADSSFELYRKICARGGEELLGVIDQSASTSVTPARRVTEHEGNYNGWPDATHCLALRRSGRRLWRLRDLVNVLRRELVSGDLE